MYKTNIGIRIRETYGRKICALDKHTIENPAGYVYRMRPSMFAVYVLGVKSDRLALSGRIRETYYAY